MNIIRHAVAVPLALAIVAVACQVSNAPSVDVRGTVTAGPTCPVMTNPPDPSCADRPVEGATLVVTTEDGSEVGRATTDADGTFRLSLPPGTYRLVPQPVDGLMGTPEPISFGTTPDGSPVELGAIAYDTGIR